jgi:misacylated tRNA(Ala) deacylase
MRCQTAAHIISAIINKETGALITGNNIDEEKVRIDFNLENFDREKFKEYIERANKFIKENHSIELSMLDREEAFKIPDLVKLQKMLPESIKKVRIVKIDDLDVQACGGTHVKNTSEIKGVELLSVENKGKNNRRIYFKVL